VAEYGTESTHDPLNAEALGGGEEFIDADADLLSRRVEGALDNGEIALEDTDEVDLARGEGSGRLRFMNRR